MVKNRETESDSYVFYNWKPAPYCNNVLGCVQSSTKLEKWLLRLKESHRYKTPQSIEEMLEMHGMRVGGMKINSSANIPRAQEILFQAASEGKSVRLTTIVCPPYHKRELGRRENVGLYTDFDSDPLNYNFLYSHTVLAESLYLMSASLQKILGIRVNPTLVVGDIALRDNDRERSYLQHESDTRNLLRQFCQSGQAYLTRMYGSEFNFTLLPLSETVAANYLPLVVPQTPDGKEQFLRLQFAEPHNNHFSLELNQFFNDILQLDYRLVAECLPIKMRDSKINQFINDSSIKCEGCDPNIYRQIWWQFVQIFSDSVLSRQKETEQTNGEYDSTFAGYWDALYKINEYFVMARSLKNTDEASVIAYFDTKFPSAGWAFYMGGSSVLFLDSKTFPLRMSKIGAYLNPF